MANLAAQLTGTSSAPPERLALRQDDVTVSYRELDVASAGVAGLLAARGVTVGDRVGVMLPNVTQFAVLYYGVLRAGAIVVPINPLLKPREVAHVLGDSGARLLFAWHAVGQDAELGAKEASADALLVEPDTFDDLLVGSGAASDVVERAPTDSAVILYTSGTTGRPKGAELTHGNLRRNADVTMRTLLRLTPDSVVFGGLPLFHSFGQTCGLNATIAAGACLTLLPRFDPGRALEILQRDRVTAFLGVPTMYAAMLNHPDRSRYDVSALEVCLSGGAALPVEVMRAFERAFGCPILEGYGLSETSPVASFNHPDRGRKPGSIGTPIEGIEMRVVDGDGKEVPPGEVGEIAIRGHNVMAGYWRDPQATRAAVPDGWFRSGDLGRQDEDGYFYVVDRKKDLILRGGFNVYPREVEEVLYEHPDVIEAAVIGLPHPTLGEEVAAAVALRPGSTASVDDLREHVRRQIASYKCPHAVWLVDALPKGPTGKILKREIRPPADLKESS